MRSPTLPSLPDHIKCRMQNGLRLLADTLWYRQNSVAPRNAIGFSLRLADLLRAGMAWADCQWLITTGYVTALSQNRDTHARKKAAAVSDLTEQTLVMLTPRGEAAIRSLEFSADGPAPLIHYDADTRELFLRQAFVLQVATQASNLDVVVKHFQKRFWRRSIPCPFEGLTNGARMRTVRDAVYNLNRLQTRLRIEFHSGNKGEIISHEIIDTAAIALCPSEEVSGRESPR